jgi:hypothetical protein
MTDTPEKSEIFTHGIQSLKHLVIGVCISFVPTLVFPICIAYQIVSPVGSSDLQEVLCGYVLGSLMYGVTKIFILARSFIA